MKQSPEKELKVNNHSDSFLKKAVGKVFGYDFFISYSHADGCEYADALAQKLTDYGFEVFLDRTSFAAGDDWKGIGRWTLNRTGNLILVATEGALKSEQVLYEVELFKQTGRHIIPVDVDGSLADESISSPIREHLSPAVLRIDQSEAVADGYPSAHAIDRISTSLEIVRQVTKRKRIVTAVGVCLTLLLIAASIGWVRSYINAKAAEKSALLAEERRLETIKELGNADWERAVTARDYQSDPVKAALLFANAGSSYVQSNDLESLEEALIGSDVNVKKTFLLEGPVREAMLFKEKGEILLWTDNGLVYLLNISDNRIIRRFDHSGLINGLFSSFNIISQEDDNILVTNSSDGTVRGWSTDNTEPLWSLDYGGTGLFSGARVLNDGKRLLTWKAENFSVTLWDPLNNKPIREFKHDQVVFGANVNREESQILSWGNDNTARLWDLNTGARLQLFKHDRAVNGALYNKDESRVMTYSLDGTVKLWKLGDERPIYTLKHPGVNRAKYSPKETYLLSTGSTGDVKLWDYRNGKPIYSMRHNGEVKGASFSQDESLLLTWGADRTVRLWKTSDGKNDHLFNHQEDVTEARFSDNQSMVITRCNDGVIRFWNCKEGNLAMSINQGKVPRGVLEYPDGSHVLSWGNDGSVRLWKQKSDRGVLCADTRSRLAHIEFNDAGTMAIAWGYAPEGGISRVGHIWDLESKQTVHRIDHKVPISGAQFSDDSSKLLTWGSDGTVWLWEVGIDNPLQVIPHTDRVFGVTFNRDCSRVLTICADGMIRLWELGDEETAPTVIPGSKVSGMKLNKDESHVLTWGQDGAVHLRDIITGEATHTYRHNNIVISHAMFNHDESNIITINTRGEIIVWDALKDNVLKSLLHDTNGQYSFTGCTMSADEKYIASWDGSTAIVWKRENGSAYREMRVIGQIWGATFTADSKRLITWPLKGTVTLWSIERGDAIKLFRNVNGAYLDVKKTRLMTWDDQGGIYKWEIPNTKAVNIKQRILDLEIRTASTIDGNTGAHRLLTEEELNEKQKAYEKLKSRGRER